MSELAVLNSSQAVSVFNSLEAFETAKKMIIPLMQSTMVPDVYRGNGANCMVAMEMSHRIGKSVLEVMQNMQIVKGNVGWKSEYVISEVNSSGLFKEPLEFVFSEDRQSCYAIATRKNGKELRGTTVTMIMAKAEGWLDKNGSKWKTMPEQMLMYRSATFFCRVFCPEVLAGVQTADEIIDIGYTAPQNDVIEKMNQEISGSADQSESHPFEEVTEQAESDAEEANTETPATQVSESDDDGF